MNTSATWPPKQIGMIFAAAGFVAFLINPFSILGNVGPDSFSANLLFVISLGVIAGAVRTEQLDTASALRCAVGSYLAIAALLLTAPIAMPFRLAPLGILIVGECLDPTREDRSLLGIPAVWREAIALGLAIAGCSLIASGFGLAESWGGGQVSFGKMLCGFVVTGVAFAVMLTSLEFGLVRKILLASYSAVLLVSAAILLWGFDGVTNEWRTANIIVTVMLLCQVWRHRTRDDVLFKIAETFAGAVLLIRSAELVQSASNALDPFFLIVSGPMLLAGLAGVALGLVLIWSDRLWCASILSKFRPD